MVLWDVPSSSSRCFHGGVCASISSMGYSCCFHRTSIHSVSALHSWFFRGASVVLPWDCHGASVQLSRFFHGASIVVYMVCASLVGVYQSLD